MLKLKPYNKTALFIVHDLKLYLEKKNLHIQHKHDLSNLSLSEIKYCGHLYLSCPASLRKMYGKQRDEKKMLF